MIMNNQENMTPSKENSKLPEWAKEIRDLWISWKKFILIILKIISELQNNKDKQFNGISKTR
jgi:hypothetical protein